MPFLDHLEELRKRLFWVAGAVVLGVVVAFVLLSKLDIIRVLERPILPLLHGQKLIYTHPGTSFHILLNASLVLGIILASPVVVGQLWGFLAPALYAHEKKIVLHDEITQRDAGEEQRHHRCDDGQEPAGPYYQIH